MSELSVYRRTSQGGYRLGSGDECWHTKSLEVIPGIERAIAWARRCHVQVVWAVWASSPNFKNLSAQTLYQYKKSKEMKGIGESLGGYPLLVSGTWGTELIEPIKKLQQAGDMLVEKNRDNAFYGTQLDQKLRDKGLKTLLFAGVNTDQCVATTMEDANFRDYNVLLIEDATGTSNPNFCKDAVLLNTRQCWGFTTDTQQLQNAQELDPK